MPSPTDGKFSWSTKRMITPPINARPTNVTARPMVTERALTILRIRRSTKDTFLPGLTRLSGTSSKFNDQVDSPCISPFARQVRFGDAVRPRGGCHDTRIQALPGLHGVGRGAPGGVHGPVHARAPGWATRVDGRDAAAADPARHRSGTRHVAGRRA